MWSNGAIQCFLAFWCHVVQCWKKSTPFTILKHTISQNDIYSHQIWLEDKMLPQTHSMKKYSSTCNATHDIYLSTPQVCESIKNHNLQLHWRQLEKHEAPCNTWHPWPNKILTQVNYNKKTCYNFQEMWPWAW
jgi:hypothetical protein